MKVEIPLSQAHRLLAPRPACLLTTRYRGQVNVMTIAWVCPVSLEPPMVMMAIHPSTYTHGMLQRSEEAVLNIPGRALAEQVAACGEASGADVDKIATTGLTLESGHRVEVPGIAECLAHIECAVVTAVTPGDHTVFVAEMAPESRRRRSRGHGGVPRATLRRIRRNSAPCCTLAAGSSVCRERRSRSDRAGRAARGAQ